MPLLTGRTLAAAAHPVAMRLDPTRRGFGPRELLAMLKDSILALPGEDDGYMALYSALNAPTGLFERAGRGRYVWLEPAPGDDSP